MNNAEMPIQAIYNSEGLVSDAGSGALRGEGMGLTKREHFAGLALQGLLSHPQGPAGEWDVAAANAVEAADALLAALEHTTEE